ncbi:hypothetical protein [Rhodococcus sp. ACT016]|uniref:hypothetical protein n=1 Tax=Rhodococcus sp. ACT016 TaxID=3134808 RepID=UPI003D2D4949
MIVLRVFGREVLAVGRQDDLDPGGADLTGGTFEIADDHQQRDPDAEVYLTSRRRRPPIVRHRAGELQFGFAASARNSSQ